MGSAQPSTGQDWLIISFAVAIIGGTALKGGSITALGILMGGIIMVLIKNGLVILGANIYFERTFYGLIILLAVIVDRVRAIYSVRSKL
jgi:ribose transport system permease protein